MQIQQTEELNKQESRNSTKGDDEEAKFSSDSDDCRSEASHQSKASCLSSKVAEGSKKIKKEVKRRKKKATLMKSGIPGCQIP